MRYKKLQVCFEVYANHHEECPMMQLNPKLPQVCNCGFREALDESRKPPEHIAALKAAIKEIEHLYPEAAALTALRAALTEETV